MKVYIQEGCRTIDTPYPAEVTAVRFETPEDKAFALRSLAFARAYTERTRDAARAWASHPRNIIFGDPQALEMAQDHLDESGPLLQLYDRAAMELHDPGTAPEFYAGDAARLYVGVMHGIGLRSEYDDNITTEQLLPNISYYPAAALGDR